VVSALASLFVIVGYYSWPADRDIRHLAAQVNA